MCCEPQIIFLTWQVRSSLHPFRQVFEFSELPTFLIAIAVNSWIQVHSNSSCLPVSNHPSHFPLCLFLTQADHLKTGLEEVFVWASFFTGQRSFPSLLEQFLGDREWIISQKIVRPDVLGLSEYMVGWAFFRNRIHIVFQETPAPQCVQDLLADPGLLQRGVYQNFIEPWLCWNPDFRIKIIVNGIFIQCPGWQIAEFTSGCVHVRG